MTYRITAKLVDSAGSPLSGKPVQFYRDGVLIATVNTDSSGVAVYSDSGPASQYCVKFAGDTQYEPSSACASAPAVAGGRCSPVFRTGIAALDQVLFCIGGYGITVNIIVTLGILIMLLFI